MDSVPLQSSYWTIVPQVCSNLHANWEQPGVLTLRHHYLASPASDKPCFFLYSMNRILYFSVLMFDIGENISCCDHNLTHFVNCTFAPVMTAGNISNEQLLTLYCCLVMYALSFLESVFETTLPVLAGDQVCRLTNLFETKRGKNIFISSCHRDKIRNIPQPPGATTLLEWYKICKVNRHLL